MVRVSRTSAQLWSFELHQANSPQCGAPTSTCLAGRSTRTAASVPFGGRAAWPSTSSARLLPYSSTSGSSQPRTYLLQAPMWVGSTWNSWPLCEPVDIRSQQPTSLSVAGPMES